MTSTMSAAERGGVQPQANVVPSAGGGRGTMLLDAYTILQHWESLPTSVLPGNDGIALTTSTGSSGAGGDDGNATSNNQYVFAQRVTVPIPQSWLVLDSAATATVFCNPQLLTDVWTVPTPSIEHHWDHWIPTNKFDW